MTVEINLEELYNNLWYYIKYIFCGKTGNSEFVQIVIPILISMWAIPYAAGLIATGIRQIVIGYFLSQEDYKKCDKILEILDNIHSLFGLRK